MVDWSDPVVFEKTATFTSKSFLFLLGLYTWEIGLTFNFEKRFLSSATRSPWRWHYLCYFVCRYFFLISLIVVNILLNTTLPRNCQVMSTTGQFFGNASIGTASLNLAFRALALWRNHRGLTVLMLILAGGHWFILFFCTTTLKATDVPGPVPTCVLIGVDRQWLMAFYVYTMAFDTFIMVTCLWGLRRTKPRGGARVHELYKLLWNDGLLYFVCASLANVLPVVFMGLQLNPAMDTVTAMPSACITAIVSCRAVQRLNSWGTGSSVGQGSTYRMSTPVRHSENGKMISIVTTQ